MRIARTEVPCQKLPLGFLVLLELRLSLICVWILLSLPTGPLFLIRLCYLLVWKSLPESH